VDLQVWDGGDTLKNIKLQHLRFFVAIFEEGSITAATARLNATQVGASVQLKDLDDILGLSLFNRSASGFAPTKTAGLLYKRARQHRRRQINRLQKDDLKGRKLIPATMEF